MRTNSNEFLALITGAAIGTIVAMLYAPERGADMRRKIANTADTAMDAISRAADELKGRAAIAIEEEKGNLESRMNALISRAHHKPEELITLLEGKLAELKRKNVKPSKKNIAANVN